MIWGRPSERRVAEWGQQQQAHPQSGTNQHSMNATTQTQTNVVPPGDNTHSPAATWQPLALSREVREQHTGIHSPSNKDMNGNEKAMKAV